MMLYRSISIMLVDAAAKQAQGLFFRHACSANKGRIREFGLHAVRGKS